MVTIMHRYNLSISKFIISTVLSVRLEKNDDLELYLFLSVFLTHVRPHASEFLRYWPVLKEIEAERAGRIIGICRYDNFLR